MPELADVRQDFTVDVSEALAGIRELIAAATDLARADAEAVAATRALSDELDSLVAPGADAAEAMSIAAGRANDLRDAMAAAGAASEEFGGSAVSAGDAASATARDVTGLAASEGLLMREVRDASADLMMQTELLRGMSVSLEAAQRDLADLSADAMMANDSLRAMEQTSWSTAMATGALAEQVSRLNARLLENAAARTARGGGAAAPGGAAGGGLAVFGLTGMALHWATLGAATLLDTGVPALVAFTTAAVNMGPALMNIGQQMNSLVIASGGLHNALLNSVGPLRSMAIAAQRTELAVAPDAYIIFGNVIAAITSKTGAFAQMARQASSVLATFSGNVVSYLKGSGGTALSGFFSEGAKFLAQWLTLLGDLGATFVNVMHGMWGVGHVILDVLVGVARAFAMMSSVPLVQWGVGALEAMHALYMFGYAVTWAAKGLGLLDAEAALPGFLTMLKTLGTAIAELVTVYMTTGDVRVAWAALTDTIEASSAAMGPLFLAMAAIAAGLAIWAATSYHARDATDKLIARVKAMPATVQNLSAGIAELSAKQAAQTQVSVRAQAQMQQMRQHAHDTGMAYRNMGVLLGQGYGTLAAKSLGAQGDVRKLSAAITQQYGKLKALSVGLAQTGAGTGVVGHYMNMLDIQSSLAATKVQQMNQAFSSFMTNVTGGTGGLAQFATSLQNIGQVAGTTANNLGTVANISMNPAQFGHALALGPVKGAAAWTNFDQVVGSVMPQFINWMNIARTEGVATSAQYSQGVLDMESAMMKWVGTSPAARASLVAIAQAQGLNITKFPQLVAAIHRTHASMGGLTRMTDKWTVGMANASGVAKDMSVMLNQQVSQAVVLAAEKAAGLTYALHGLMMAEKKGSYHNRDLAYWQGQVALAEHKTAQYSRDAAGAQHAAQNRAHQYALQLQQVHRWLQLITSTPYNIRVNMEMLTHGGLALPGMGRNRITVPGMGSGSTQKLASGGTAKPGVALVGEKGPELVVMHGGEHVIPHEATKHLMGMTHGVKGYASGTTGIMAELARVIANALARITGTFKSPPPVMGEISHLISLIDSAAKKHDITGSTKSSLTTFLLHDNTRLSALAHQRDLILKRIHAAQQYAASVQSAAAGTGSLSTLTQNGPQSSGSMLAGMNQALAGIREFGSDIRRLAHMGLDRNLLNQIIQMGPVQGAQVAQALLNGPMSNISAMNSTESQIQSASKGLGKSAANMMYDSGKHAGHGFLSGLHAQEAAITREMGTLARDIVTTLDRGLGLHVPVPHGHGHHAAGHITAALRHEAGHVPSALRHAAGAGSGGDVVVHQHLEIMAPDGNALFQAIQPEALRVNRRNPTNNLSLQLGRGRMR